MISLILMLIGVLSMYTHNQASQGLVGTDGVVDPSDLELRGGFLGSEHCFALTTNSGTEVVLRGAGGGSPTAALESFVDKVLVIGHSYVRQFTKDIEEYNEWVQRQERETS